MTGQQLKNAILALAVQGKLVPQDQTDEPAAELLKRIKAEKARLVKDGKIKKEKPLPAITEEEKPFDIPESWEWVRLGVCSTYGQPKVKATAKDIKSKIWSLDLEDIEKGTGHIIVKRQASDKPIRGEKVKFEKGDILYSKLRPYLKKIVVADDNGICTTEIVPFKVFGNINVDYISYVLRSPHIDYEINAASYGAKMPRVGTDTMLQLLIPIPPLAEQKRIVAKIEEILPRVSVYDTAEQKLSRLDADFPDKLKKSILQQAVQGKLVKQDKNDEPAGELLKQIKAEKDKLIAEGKIKKEKPLPPITEEEKPFDLPVGWEWVRLLDVCEAIVDCPHSTPKYFQDETGFAGIDTNCIDANGNITGWRYVSQEIYEKRIERLVPQGNDIIFTREGSIGRAAILPHDKKICLGQRVMLLRPSKFVNMTFLQHFLMAPVTLQRLTSQQKGLGAKHINVSDVYNLPLALPPLAEQQRIVKQVGAYLLLYDKIVNCGKGVAIS